MKLTPLPGPAPDAFTRTRVKSADRSNRVHALETALLDVLEEAEVSDTHPELSFVATQRIAARVRQVLAEGDEPTVTSSSDPASEMRAR